MFSQKRVLKNLTTGQLINLVKQSFTYPDSREHQWFIEGSKTQFSDNAVLLKQLEEVSVNCTIYDTNESPIYVVMSRTFVGGFH